MRVPRHFAIALAAAAVSIAALAAVLAVESRRIERRWTVQVAPRPSEGQQVFAEKGCSQCHGAAATGTQNGPALRQRVSLTTVPRLVSAMWNHAPRMWQAIESQRLDYPSFSQEESAQLIAYLYISGYSDSTGDAARGRALFTEKRCASCHKRGVDALVKSADSPLTWTQNLWNHAATMSDRMAADGIPWPQFEDGELRDLFAYVAQERLQAQQFATVSGSPEDGWRVFQSKSCSSCHDPTGKGSATTFGEGYHLPPSFAEFGASLLNHIPQMRAALRERGRELPKFSGQEISDLTVFLYTLHYLEPGGSPDVGRSVFTWRGCGACHGADGDGTRNAPALRGRANAYTAARLASDLWKHGARMQTQARKGNRGWPILEETDIGNMLAFLNTPPRH